jgi:hypothetical protein
MQKFINIDPIVPGLVFGENSSLLSKQQQQSQQQNADNNSNNNVQPSFKNTPFDNNTPDGTINVNFKNFTDFIANNKNVDSSNSSIISTTNIKNNIEATNFGNNFETYRTININNIEDSSVNSDISGGNNPILNNSNLIVGKPVNSLGSKNKEPKTMKEPKSVNKK